MPNAFSSIPGPIFQKEVWVSGRKWVTYWARGLYSGGLLAIVSLIYLGQNDSHRGAAESLQAFQSLAPMVASAIIWFQCIALTLAAAVFAAPSICDERRAGTLSALLTTPLRPWQIIFGKVASQFTQLLILALASSPLLLGIRVFGGVPAEVILATTLLSLSTALLTALLAMALSTEVKRSPTAIVGGLAGMMVIQFGPPLILLLMMWGSMIRGPGPGPGGVLFACMSTPIAMGFVTADLHNGAGTAPQATVAWVLSTVYTLLWCALIFWIACFRLRRSMAADVPPGSPSKTLRQQTPSTAIPVPNALVTPSHIPHPPSPIPHSYGSPSPTQDSELSTQDSGLSPSPREVSDFPILWRELRQNTFRNRKFLFASIAVVVGVLGLIYYNIGIDEQGTTFVVIVVSMVISLVLAAVSTTASIAGERESRTLETLLTTPLSAREIVLSKFAGGLRRQWFMPLVMGAHLSIALLAGRIHIGAFLHIALLLSSSLAALTATGVLFSTLCRKSTAAAALNFGLAIGLWAGIPFLAAMFDEFAGAGNGDAVITASLSINPITLTVVSLIGAMKDLSWTARTYDMFDSDSVSIVWFTLIAIVFWAVMLGAAWMALRVAAAVLAARTGRAR